MGRIMKLGPLLIILGVLSLFTFLSEGVAPSGAYATSMSNHKDDSTRDTEIEWEVQGQINDEPIAATGLLEFLRNGDFDASLEFSQLPTSFHIAASGFSVVSISCSNGGRPIAGALNLISLTGGDYKGFRNFIIRDPSGELVGDFTATLDMRRYDDEHFKATVSLDGFYKGPTNLVDVTDYDLPLSQRGKGRVGGEYAATFTTADGDIFVIDTKTEYTYTGERTLPSDEVLKVRYESFSFENDEHKNGEYAAVLELTGNSTIVPFRLKNDKPENDEGGKN